VWLVEVSGLIVDTRMLPIENQAEAQRLGLIPNLPFGRTAQATSTAITAAQKRRAEAGRGARVAVPHDCFCARASTRGAIAMAT